MSDDLVFSDESPTPAQADTATPWQVLIVDDEPGVHDVTKLVMSDFKMDGRPLQFLDCYSADEAKLMLAQPNDIALILLDVVMETDRAGLELARHIREDLKNHAVRIVLRTGQAGQAPEEQVIRDYDINDYREKTELTRRKLITVFYSGLRSYRDLMRIERARMGLRRSIEAITRVCDSQSLRTFASAVLEQVNYLLNLNGQGLCASRTTAYTACAANGHIKVLAATEDFSSLLVDDEIGNLPMEVRRALDRSIREKSSHFGEKYYLGYYRTKSGSESMIYMHFLEPLSESSCELLELFSSNVAITYDNLLTREEIEATQRATISVLGEAIERRSNNTSDHTRRVGEISALLADWLGMPAHDVEVIRQAATLHDAGKIRIPNEILIKPGKLDAKEWDIIKTHPQLGFDMLSTSSTAIHQMGATAALEHHERWDGTGYPRALAGENISIIGRLVAVADVLDALVSPSFYKTPWILEASLAHLRAESGKQFDPQLIEMVMGQKAAIESIYEKFPIEPTAGM
jgi:response regulator RpfG family c-di-GMP phosphodiesterase